MNDWSSRASRDGRVQPMPKPLLPATVIRSIRRTQGREAAFDRYYQGLLTTYTRFAALKDELRYRDRGTRL